VLKRRNFSVTWRTATRTTALSGVRFHDLRHLAATLAATVPGTTARDLMSRLGHSSARAALRYQHAAAERDAAIAAYLGNVLNARQAAAEAIVVSLRPSGA
jgi:integrase